MSRGELFAEIAEHGPEVLEKGYHALHPHQTEDGSWMVAGQKVAMPVSMSSVPAVAAMMPQQTAEMTANYHANRDALKAQIEAARGQFEEDRAKHLEVKHSVNLGGMNVDKETAYSMGEMGLQFLGPMGMVASIGAGAGGGYARGEREMDSLVDNYRDVTAKILNIAPEQVNAQSLQLAARVRAEKYGDTTLQEAISHANGEKRSGAAKAAGSLGGFFGGMAVGNMLLPGIGGFIGGGLGAMGADKVIHDTFIGDKEDTAAGQIDALSEKYNAGEAISASDVFAVRMQQLKRLEVLVDEKCSSLGLKKFEKLDDYDRAKVMKHFPDVLQASTRDAALIQNGVATPDQLALGTDLQAVVLASGQLPSGAAQTANVNMAPSANVNAVPQGGWTQRVGGQRAMQQGGFAERVAVERAAAASMSQQL